MLAKIFFNLFSFLHKFKRKMVVERVGRMVQERLFMNVWYVGPFGRTKIVASKLKMKII